ncbi:Ig-like domain-containing protein [Pendulispora brunnea]|uniref:Ig-like domain-containing protein n=1 Tax=Pendulispora brunnea TaxID=2905690 RepID=A0ABZ2JYN8_9BACT
MKQPGAIVSVSPAENDDNVSVHAPITIEYNVPVQVTPSSVTLSGPNAAVIATTLRVSDDGKTVTVAPIAEVPAPTKLTLTINEIRTREGAIAEKKTWSWTLPAWLRVEAANQIAGEAALWSSPIVAVGSADKIITTVSNKGLTLAQLDGSLNTWSQMGDPLDIPAAPRPSLAFDKDGALVMAYMAPKGPQLPYEIRVRRWSGSAWEPMGQALDDAAGMCPYACFPVIARARDTGQLFVAYTRPVPGEPGPETLVVKTFADGQWKQVGSVVSDSSQGARYLALVIADSGVPFVLYTSEGDTKGTWVKKLSQDGSWATVGSTPNLPNENPAYNNSLALDASGNPAVLGCYGGKYQLRRFDGNQWVGGGENSRAGCGTYESFLASNGSGRLFAFWSSSGVVQAADVTNANWQLLDPTPSSGNLRAGSLTVGPTGIPVIGWAEDNKTIRVRRLNR